MQRAYITELYELISNDENVVSLLSDSGTDYDDLVAREYPDQCFNFGIGEQNQIAAASGMASCGKIPFVYTSGAFLAYRSFEFIRNDVCFQNANVKIVGMGSGLSWSTLGPSHHTTEDVAVLRAIPNLKILNPASPEEVKKVVVAAYEIVGPVYIRLGMSKEKEIYDGDYDFVVGKNITIREGNDIAIFTTGSIISEALEAAEMLEENGVSSKVINVHTIKPFDSENAIEIAKDFKRIYTVEEHNVFGGLGSILSEVIACHNYDTALNKIGLDDCFASGYGTHAEIKKINKLDARSIYNRIMDKD